MMTQQDFDVFRNDVEGSAVSFENQPDGSTLVKCSDGVVIRVEEDGSSRTV